MALAEVAAQFFAYESRLASFQTVHKRRGSSANSRAAKTLIWPHKSIAPTDLAKAGFFFNPLSSNPDNVACFLCHKSLDGWENGDIPLDEHLKHSPNCGWAIVAAIEADVGDYGKENPNSKAMVEARKSTFGGRWPHEGKKGWKCKTKQLADAGWKYTPTPEYDDMATCTYCQLALDGWEPGDKPLDEHYKRSPDCPFFVLGSQVEAPKRAARGKGTRTSKASRLSVQSVATVASEASSAADLPAEHEDSVLTTVSKKGTKGRKAGTAKSRKAKAKKDESVETQGSNSQEVEIVPPPKPARGRKRASDAMEDSVVTATEPPAAKKRATRARGSNTADASVLSTHEDTALAKQPTGRKKGRGSTAKSTRKASGSSLASKASTASLRAAAMSDNDEIDKQLQADLERPLTDDEDIMVDSDSERKKPAPAKPKPKGRPRKGTTASQTSQSSQESNDYGMFDPTPVVPDEAAIDEELKAMQAQMQVPKKGRKATGTRKASKQTKGKKVDPKEPEVAAIVPQEEPVVEAHDDSIASATVINSKAAAEPPIERKRGRPKKSDPSQSAMQKAQDVEEARAAEAEAENEPATAQEKSPKAVESPTKSPLPLAAKDKALPKPPSPKRRPVPPPSTPGGHISPAASARQAVLSPSQSPQSSDAENQPPSSKAAASETTRRVALAPAQTPRALSPSKRNVIAGLNSTTPWTAVDLDSIFGSPVAGSDKENAPRRFLAKGPELTSPEQRMTVEEWIYYNAGQAEQKLKHECETVVSMFETEGTRAMQALEGITVD